MKKLLALIVSVAMVALLLPMGLTASVVSASATDYSDIVSVRNLATDWTSTSGNVHSNTEIISCLQEDGQITLKVRLGQWGDYIQFAQGVTDLINSGAATLEVNLENHELDTSFPGTDENAKAPYKNCNFQVAVTENANPAVGVPNAWWQLKGGELVGVNALYIHTGVKTVTNNYAPIFTQANYLMSQRGVAFSFDFKTDANGKLYMQSRETTIAGENYGIPAGTTTTYQPAADNTPVYVRLMTFKDQTYHIRLKSKDIKAPADPSEYVKIYHNNSNTSTSDQVTSAAEIISFKKEEGKITVKVKLGAWDYIQIAQPTTDLLNNAAAGVDVNIGGHELDTTCAVGAGNTVYNDPNYEPYRSCNFAIAVTPLSDYTQLIPNASFWQLKGDKNVLYNSGDTIHVGVQNTAGATRGCYFVTDNKILPTRGVAFPFQFGTDAAGSIKLTSKVASDNTFSTANTTNPYYKPEANAPLYVRLTSYKEQIYTIRLNSADITLNDAEPEIEVEDVEVADGDEFVNDTRGFGVLGAQVRTTDNSLRFVARISQALIDKLSENGGEVKEYGIALVSENYFGANGGGNGKTALELDGSNTTAVNKNTVAKVKAEKIYKDFEDYNNYTAVITGLQSQKQMSTRFCARAYVIYTDADGVEHTYYATEDDNDAGVGNYKTGYGAYWKSLDQAKADLLDAN